MNLALRLFGRFSALVCALGSALLLAPPGHAAEFALGPGDRVVGNLADYVVQPGDNLADIARHYDIGYTEMLAANPGVDPWSPPPGRKLTIPGLFILPDVPHRGIVINLAERRLYYFPPDSATVQTYPIGIGAIGFTTPLSTTRVVRKEPHPTWVPPPSIHAENPDLPAVVGPGPDNPLGDYALRLGWSNYLIHGTNKPDGVGRNVSHGCIHLYPEDIEQLFNSVPAGTPVRAVEQSAAAAWIGIGLYVEAHPNKEQADAIDTDQPVTPVADATLRDTVSAVAGNYAQSVDWNAVDQASVQLGGVPVLVAQRPPQDMMSPAPADTAAPENIAQAPTSDGAEVVPLDDRAPTPRHRVHRAKPKPRYGALR
jgi:L,D-transpeptidase ErfK/SrfK